MLDPEAVGELLRSIDTYAGHAITRIAMQVGPHVMARPGELRQAIWPEFDLEAATWKIPAERMKMRRPHRVPPSRQVVAYLKELYALTGPDGYVFPAFHTFRRPLSENTINQAFRRMGYAVGEITAHGLRTTASSLLRKRQVEPGRDRAVAGACRQGCRTRHLQSRSLLGGTCRYAPVVERLSG